MKKSQVAFLAILLICVLCCTAACAFFEPISMATLHLRDGVSERITYTSEVRLPVPTWEGHTFEGWYLDEECTQPFNEGTVMRGRFDLYAKWSEQSGEEPAPPQQDPDKYTVTFVFYDGVTSSQPVGKGSMVVLPSNPMRSGYIFGGWYMDEECTRLYDGRTVTSDMVLYAKWYVYHTEHDFGGSYFMYVKCAYDGCDAVGRETGERLYDSNFTFDSTRNRQITQHANAARSALGETVDAFVQALHTFEQDIEYLSGQYTWLTLYSDADQGALSSYNMNLFLQSYTNDLYLYYRLFPDADATFGEEFWTTYGDDREAALQAVEQYLDSAESSNEAESVLSEYRQAMAQYYSSYTTFDSLYGRLVSAYNKQAQSYGYDNYIEYAYSEIYNREYTPEQTQTLHDNVKEYIAPALVEVNIALNAMYRGSSIRFSDETNRDFYETLDSTAIVRSYITGNISERTMHATQYIGEYFRWLNANTDSGKDIDFYGAVNEMFAEGNYFSGRGEGAYTAYADYDNKPAVYIMDDSRYDVAFTFVHEFGHYYNYVYNGERYLSYDHDETHSQGDEMLFLAWLKANKPSGVTDGMTALELTQLENMLHTVCIASAVDELEQAAYTGYYEGLPVTGGYHELFGRILDSYGTQASAILKQNGNQAYWYYVAFENACYYVSYAMSALPSIDLYTVAERQGIERAKDMYIRLFTYCDDDERMRNYSYTGEGGVLDFCGLDSPFGDTLYTNIRDYALSLDY